MEPMRAEGAWWMPRPTGRPGCLTQAYSRLFQCVLQELGFALCYRWGKNITMKEQWLCNSKSCFAVSLTGK